MKKLIFLYYFIILFQNLTYAQKVGNNIEFINLSLSHSKRIPNHIVIVKITNEKNNCIVKVISKPKIKDKEWENTYIDTSYIISHDEFSELTNALLPLGKIDLDKAFRIKGVDGSTFILEFGNTVSSISYKFWTPNAYPNERGLSDFLKICEKILIVGKLDPLGVF